MWIVPAEEKARLEIFEIQPKARVVVEKTYDGPLDGSPRTAVVAQIRLRGISPGGLMWLERKGWEKGAVVAGGGEVYLPMRKEV